MKKRGKEKERDIFDLSNLKLTNYDIEVTVDGRHIDEPSASNTERIPIANNTTVSIIGKTNNNNHIENEKNRNVKLGVEVHKNIKISLPHEKCMKCLAANVPLLCTCTHSGVIGLCTHKFCQSCFQQWNRGLHLNNTFTCPCCHIPLYQNVLSIEEAILIGEAATLSVYLFPHISPSSQLSFATDDEVAVEDILRFNDMNKLVIEKLVAALELNPTNFDTLYALFLSCSYGHTYLIERNMSAALSDFYSVELFYYAYKLLRHPSLSGPRESVRGECYYEVACVYSVYRNYPAAKLIAKRAYDHTPLSTYKSLYLEACTAVAAMPPLRFAVGDEVEYLCELETGSEWAVGKVDILYYIENNFDISFTAPYRVKLVNKDGIPDSRPRHTVVKADTDRYIHKVGVRSIEDTPFKARLDAKVAELTHVHCSTEFIQSVYGALAQDREFIDMLQSVWRIEMSESTIRLYRMRVMHRQLLVRTDSGYHLPTVKEVVADIRAFFNPAHLSSDAASSVGEDSYSMELRADLISMFRGTHEYTYEDIDDSDVQGLLLRSISCFLAVMQKPTTPADSSIGLDQSSVFTVSLEYVNAISRVCTTRDLISFQSGVTKFTRLWYHIDAWIGVHTCLENPDAGSACECQFVYFFVKHCLVLNMGVPKLALALYDRMNMQLARGFIQCANPVCELSHLDQSAGQVKFQKCSRCQAVIYCSKECQATHYPEHVSFCSENAVG